MQTMESELFRIKRAMSLAGEVAEVLSNWTEGLDSTNTDEMRQLLLNLSVLVSVLRASALPRGG